MTGTSPFTVVGDETAEVCEDGACVVPETSTGTSGSLQEIPFSAVDGSELTLSDYAGQVVMVVNVASKCGLTPQYEGLQRLYDAKVGQGFTVIGFPANDFMGQEPGTDAEIAEFCSLTYAVTFPIMSKISVIGEHRHPLYTELIRQAPTAPGKDEFREQALKSGGTPTEDPEVLWNFEKFLIGRDGTVLARFAPGTTPDGPALIAAVDAALAVPANP